MAVVSACATRGIAVTVVDVVMLVEPNARQEWTTGLE